MKKLIIISTLSLFLMYSCKEKQEDIVLLSQNEFEVQFDNNKISKITTTSEGVLVNQEILSIKNDTTRLSIMADSYGNLLQKRFYYIGLNGKTYSSIDTIYNDNVISHYDYAYNAQGFLVNQVFEAEIYSDLFITPNIHVTGVLNFTIENENTVKMVIEKNYEGAYVGTEKEVYDYYFVDEQNVDGIQYFSMDYLGTKNKNLVDSVRYTHYKNDVQIETGCYSYSYILDMDSKRIVQESESYHSNNEKVYDRKTINKYTYTIK